MAAFPAGVRMVMHTGCAEPPGLAAALAEAAPRLRDAVLYTLMPMAVPPYAAAAAPGHLALRTFFPGHGLRRAVAAGDCEVLRLPLSAIPASFRDGTHRADVVLLQVAPPDAGGNVSLGISIDYMPAVIAGGAMVIAEVNPALPFTRGATTLPLQAIACLVDGAGPVQAFTRAAPDAVDVAIAGNVAALVGDGAVLQAGIGAIPETVLGLLADHRGLGMRTGIVTDPVRALIDAGALDVDDGKRRITTTMAAGTQAFYDHLDGNPLYDFQPCDASHDFATLAAVDGLVAINGALQVDLAGRVNAEAISGRTVSAPGGLPDFARAASAARGGLSVIALRSTSRDGAQSSIVPLLGADVPLTVGPEHVGYVVTEHGVARLAGRDARTRARELAAVAAPEFRAALRRPAA